MKQFVLIGAVLFQLLAICIAQRVAPGVPPQHYQNGQGAQYQPPPPPQHQQQHQQQHHQQQQPQQLNQHQQQHVQHQQQYQQVPVNQQPPVQHQQQQQPPAQQQPQGHGHGHGHGPPHQNQVLGANIQQEKDHIQEHMEVPIDTSKMSEQELQFHYFKMHDADNNNKLDGCELIKSLIHWHEQGSKEAPNPEVPHVEEKVFADQELVSLIDPILQMDDYNRDGFIDYPEFVHAQQKAAANSQQQQAGEQHQQQQQQQQPPHP